MIGDEQDPEQLAALAAGEREAAIRSAVALQPFRRPEDVVSILSAGGRTVGGVHHCNIAGKLVSIAEAVEEFAATRTEYLAAPDQAAVVPKMGGTRSERQEAIRQRFGLT